MTSVTSPPLPAPGQREAVVKDAGTKPSQCVCCLTCSLNVPAKPHKARLHRGLWGGGTLIQRTPGMSLWLPADLPLVSPGIQLKCMSYFLYKAFGLCLTHL